MGCDTRCRSTSGASAGSRPTTSTRRIWSSLATATSSQPWRAASVPLRRRVRRRDRSASSLAPARPRPRAAAASRFAEFRTRGASAECSLDVDSENPTGATKLYERAGMTVEIGGRRLRARARMKLRAPRDDDFDAILELMNAHQVGRVRGGRRHRRRAPHVADHAEHRARARHQGARGGRTSRRVRRRRQDERAIRRAGGPT